MFSDLHLHTSFSDGTYTPEFLASEARRYELAAVALTDHDTVEGCVRMGAACAQLGVEFIPACEFTSESQGTELHLIGYFLNIDNAVLLQQTRRFQEVRQNRIIEMVGRLQELNVNITVDQVSTLANCKSPGRPHIARVLIQNGVCRTLDEAFERFLKKGRPGWVPKFKIDAADAIALIHQSGGLAVMAHPALVRRDELVPGLVAAGLDGLECYHTKHPPTTVEHYLAMAAKHKLLITGGSDCHGMNKGKPLIGSVKLPYHRVTELKERLASDHPARQPVPQKL